MSSWLQVDDHAGIFVHKFQQMSFNKLPAVQTNETMFKQHKNAKNELTVILK